MSFYSGYTSWLIKYLIAALVITLVFYLLRWRKKPRTRIINEEPPDFWFYLALVDIEIAVKPISSLQATFLTYIHKKYDKKFRDNSIEAFIAFINEHEKQAATAVFIKNLYAELELLKHKNTEDVINYIKEIKLNFIGKDLSVWLTARQDDDCHNC